MKNTKTTRRALLSGVMALIICVTMLMGTTFAWFTDTAVTAVNKVLAGTLDVALEMKDANGNWVNAEGETLNWKKASGTPAGEQVIWEPGCTYELPEIRIVNKGDLALKYRIIISGIVGDAKLLDVISFTYGDGIDINAEVCLVPGAATEGITVKGHMSENAGNEYQGLSIDGIGITVLATQDTYEYDSTSNQYDTDATYLNQDEEGNYLISNANELVYFAMDVNVNGNTYSGKTVKLISDIDLAGKNWIPVGPNADTPNKFQGTFDGNGMTIKNLTINTASSIKYQATGFFGALNGIAKNFTIDGAEVKGISAPNMIGNTDNGIAVVAGSVYTSGTIDGVTVKNASVSGNRYVGGVSGYTYGNVKNCTVQDVSVTATPDNLSGTWDNGDKAGGVAGAFWHENSYEISGNSAVNVTVTGYRDLGGVVGYANGNVTGNSVSGLTLIQDYSILTTTRTTVEAIVGRHDGYVVDGSNSASDVTTFTQYMVSTSEELSEALNKTYTSDTIIKLTDNITLSGEWGEHILKLGSCVNVIIDGNGRTIFGLTSNQVTNSDGFLCNGLITGVKSTHHSSTTLGTLTVKDLTVDGANISSEGVFASSGVIAGSISFVHFVAENCTITNATVNSSFYAGGFIGYAQHFNYGETVTLKNCTVSDSTFSGNDATAALIALSNQAVNIDGVNVTGNSIVGGNGYSASALVGTSIGGTTVTDATVDSNSFDITNTTGYQVNSPNYGYIYNNGNTYSVNGTELDQ